MEQASRAFAAALLRELGAQGLLSQQRLSAALDLLRTRATFPVLFQDPMCLLGGEDGYFGDPQRPAERPDDR